MCECPQAQRSHERTEFFTELKRRNVYKVAVAYAVVARLLMQVASQIFPFFEIPNWVVRLVVVLLVIGFPIALHRRMGISNDIRRDQTHRNCDAGDYGFMASPGFMLSNR